MKLIILFTLLNIVTPIVPSGPDTEKEALQALLKERELKFGHYARAAESKTGFFGNQTKKDIRQANQVLIEIIKTDNRMIFLLNNFLDYRNFQKTEMTYSHKDQTEQINELNNITDNLLKKSELVKKENDNLKKEVIKSKTLNYILGIICMVIGGLALWKKFRNRELIKNPSYETPGNEN